MGLVRMTEMCVGNCQTLYVDFVAVNHVPFVTGLLQEIDMRPVVNQIKYM